MYTSQRNEDASFHLSKSAGVLYRVDHIGGIPLYRSSPKRLDYFELYSELGVHLSGLLKTLAKQLECIDRNKHKMRIKKIISKSIESGAECMRIRYEYRRI